MKRDREGGIVLRGDELLAAVRVANLAKNRWTNEEDTELEPRVRQWLIGRAAAVAIDATNVYFEHIRDYKNPNSTTLSADDASWFLDELVELGHEPDASGKTPPPTVQKALEKMHDQALEWTE